MLRGLKDLGNEEKLRRFDAFIQENELAWMRIEINIERGISGSA